MPDVLINRIYEALAPLRETLHGLAMRAPDEEKTIIHQQAAKLVCDVGRVS